MKKCTYCGKEYTDDYFECPIDQRPLGLIKSASGIGPEGFSDPPTSDDEDLIRDRPKFVIVAGIWLICGIGLTLNTMILFAVLTGSASGPLGLFYFMVSIACGGVCAYLLNRALKNYRIHKTRAADETND